MSLLLRQVSPTRIVTLLGNSEKYVKELSQEEKAK
jgi:hypothetical protein